MGVDPGDKHTNLSVDDTTVTPNPGGGARIFPEQNEPGGQMHDKVKVRVTVEPTLPTFHTMTVYVKDFDVDDPTQNRLPGDKQNPCDPNDTASQRKGEDNMQSSKLNPTGDRSATIPGGQDHVDFEYQLYLVHPGDNWVVAASFSQSQLGTIDIDTATGTTLRFTTTPSTQVPAAWCTEMLTVWRTLHIEEDSMKAPTGNENAVLTGAVAMMESAANGPKKVFVPTTDALESGRFEGGSIEIGPNKAKTSGLTGNGTDYVEKADGTGINVPCEAKKPGNTRPSHVKRMYTDGGEDRFEVSESIPATYNGGQFLVCGSNPMTILGITGFVKVDSFVDIPVVLRDDDHADVLPKESVINLALMNQKFAPAFIVAVRDGGGNEENNRQDNPFKENFEFEKDKNDNITVDDVEDYFSADPHVFQSMSNRSKGYWIVEVLVAFQPRGLQDNDPNSEVPRLGECGSNDGRALVYRETIRECYSTSDDDQDEDAGRVVIHEIGHALGIFDDDLEDYSLYDPDWLNDLSHECPSFNESQIQRIRFMNGLHVGHHPN